MMINKYRAWVKSEKRYIVDTQDFIPLIVTNKGVMKLQSQFEKNYYEILPLDWFIIEQFTGLHDKNGVEIYEGDIIKGKEWEHGNSHRHIGVVTYIVNAFRSVGINKYLGFHGSVDGSYEVIGNIHERNEDNDKQQSN